MARKQREEESGGSWMDTYGDMVTLLLTFFIVLYSQSSIQDDKWAKLVNAFNRNATTKVDQIVFVNDNVSGGDDIPGNSGSGSGLSPESNTSSDVGIGSGYDRLFQLISEYVDKNGMSDSIEVSNGAPASNPGETTTSSQTEVDPGQKNIYITFKDNILFMPDKATLRAGSADTLAFVGDCLKDVEDDILLVVVKGHTASSNTSTVDSRILSSERASTVSNFFEDECLIPETMLIPLGLGSTYPIATNDTEEGRTLNRRVEIVIVGKGTQLGQSGEILNVLGAAYSTDVKDVNELTE